VIGKDTANVYYDVLTVADGLLFSTTYSKAEILSQLTEINKRDYEALIMKAAEDFNFQPSVIGGVGSRESFWGLILTPKGPTGTGDGGHGRGLMQIDDRFHVFARTGNWKDPEANIRFGCDLLADNRAVLKREGLTGRGLLRATLASYNGGLGAVLRALDQGVDVDSVTTGRDYGKDVLDRAGWFQKFAEWS
jgi:soluble lytic murein transglycosylase-like protein